MIRLLKKVAVFLSALIVFLSGMPMKAAALEPIDQNADVFLTIQFLDKSALGTGQSVPFVDVQFDLYYVATVNGYDNYTLDGDFKNYPIKIDGLNASLTSTIWNYVHAYNLKPIDSCKTNGEGIVVFPNRVEKLLPGVYFVDAKEKVGTGYSDQADSFIVCLPGVDAEGENWQYDVSVSVKHRKRSIDPFNTIDCGVLKDWEGDVDAFRPKEVVIELRRNGKLYETVKLNEANNWRYLWKDLLERDGDNRTINWNVVEKSVEDYKVTVTKEGITFKITNTYHSEGETGETVRRVAQKTWDDKGYETKRPSSIKVHLLKNGEIHDTQTLNESNGWKYTWEELPAKDEQGKEIKWTIREEEPSGYIANYVQMGDNYLITNSVKKPTLPQTGMLWWPVPVLIAAGLIMLILGRLLKGRYDHA